MPPYLYWPDDPWEVVFTSSAFSHGVHQADIDYLICLPERECRCPPGGTVSQRRTVRWRQSGRPA